MYRYILSIELAWECFYFCVNSVSIFAVMESVCIGSIWSTFNILRFQSQFICCCTFPAGSSDHNTSKQKWNASKSSKTKHSGAETESLKAKGINSVMDYYCSVYIIAYLLIGMCYIWYIFRLLGYIKLNFKLIMHNFFVIESHQFLKIKLIVFYRWIRSKPIYFKLFKRD